MLESGLRVTALGIGGEGILTPGYHYTQVSEVDFAISSGIGV